MDDLSAFLKKGFQRLHQKALEKDYKQKTINDRREDYTNIRRKTRETLMLQKRNIDLNNFTPICTPEVEKRDINIRQAAPPPNNNNTITKNTVPQQNNKRLEMLKKWKEAKEKRQLEEKKNAKPLFKIYHVPVAVGLPNLENVNKEIKGKLIKKTESFKSNFAPDNHKFRPPKNIVPIQMKNPKEKLQKFELRKNTIKTNSQDNLNKVNKVKNGSKSVEVKKTTTKPTPSALKKAEPVKRVNSIKEKTLKSNITAKQPNTKKTPKKGVMWDVVEVIDSDDELLTQEINTKTPKKTYNKTPLKKRVTINSGSYSSFNGDSVTAGNKKINSSVSYDTVPTPKKNEKLTTNKTDKAKKINFKSSSSSININGPSRTSKTPVRNESKRKSTTRIASSSQANRYASSSEEHSSEIDQSLKKEANKKLKRSISFEEVIIPTKKTPQKLNVSFTKTDNRLTPQSRKLCRESSDTDDNSIVLTRKMTASPSFDDVLTGEETNVKSGSDKTDDDSFIVSKNMKKLSTTKAKSVLYNDDEVTLMTPIKKLATPRKSILKSVEKMFSKRTSTPVQPERNEPTVYISPFVTISRGKESARKEYKLRLSTGGTVPNTPEFSRVSTKNTSPGAGAAYFLKKLQNEVERIEALCLEWTVFKEEIPEEVQDMVDAAIGQSKLLISKKFQQFRNLIKLCTDESNKDRVVTCTDLHGYWDTMYMQVEDIDKRFNNLQRLKDNNWKEILIPDKKPVTKRPRGRPKKITAQSKIKDMVKNARMRKNNPGMVNGDGEPPLKPFEIVNQPGETVPSAKKRKSLLEVNFGNKEGRKSSSSSPGLAMLRISQAIKCGDGLTPSKSILKTDSKRSEQRPTKSVIFKDLEEDKENNFENLMSFSPVTPRRSRRLSRVT